MTPRPALSPAEVRTLARLLRKYAPASSRPDPPAAVLRLAAAAVAASLGIDDQAAANLAPALLGVGMLKYRIRPDGQPRIIVPAGSGTRTIGPRDLARLEQNGKGGSQ